MRIRAAARLIPICLALGASCGSILDCSPSIAAEKEQARPLHQQIDAQIAAAGPGKLAPRASDAEFLRRIYLDLVGTIPSAAEAREFFDDGSTDKRLRLIDRLLADDRHASHLATVISVFLMERRRGKHVAQEEWLTYLEESVRTNKPWNQLAREILAGDSKPEVRREPAKFYLDRDGDPDLITRDIARVFFGKDLQCCQCHDHPLIATYYQSDYFGIYAFVNRGFVFTAPDKKTFYAEKAEGNVEFTSVFTEEKDTTLPRLPGGLEISEPIFLSGEEYEVKPDKNVRPIPRYSRRDALADLATAGDSTAFNRNIVNRLWAFMMGRGLVHPLDLDHEDNAPSHPALMSLLAEHFAANGYEIREFLRELAQTRVYQQSAILPVPDPADTFAHRLESLAAALSAAEERHSREQAVLDQSLKQLASAREAVSAARTSFEPANTELAKSMKALTGAKQKDTEAQKKLRTERATAVAVNDAAEKTEAAASILKEDSLKNAAQQFRKRATELNKKVEALAKSAAELATKAAAAQEDVATKRAAATALKATLEDAERQYAAVGAPVLAARRAVELAAARRASLDSQLTITREFVRNEALARESSRLQREIANTSTRHSAVKRQLSVALTDLAPLDAQLERESAAAKAATELLAESNERLMELKKAFEAVDAAAVTAEKAAAKLDQKDPLKTVSSTIRQRGDELRDELSQATQQHATHTNGLEVATASLARSTKRRNETAARIERHRQQIAELEQKSQQLVQALAAEKEAHRSEFEEWVQFCEQHFFVAGLKPLSPEQMARATMQATGFTDRQTQSAISTADANLPPSPTLAEDRAAFIRNYVDQRTKSPLRTFVGLFGHAGGQPQGDFFATVDQALFFSNAGTVQSWVRPAAGNLAARLEKMTSAADVADELYLSVMTRPPSTEEVSNVERYLTDRAEHRPAAIQEMIWGLLTSAEFRFNH